MICWMVNILMPLKRELPRVEKGNDMDIVSAENIVSEKKARLHALIQDIAFLRREPPKKPFKLASGELSYQYFDVKKITQSPEGIALIADIIFDMIKDYDIAGVGGLESSAITISTAVAQVSHYGNHPIPAFWVRKDPRTHGTENLIEGHFSLGSEVVILDDVTTKGSSVKKAVDTIRSQGCEVKEIITVVDREDEAEDKFKAMGIPFRWIFKKSDFNNN